MIKTLLSEKEIDKAKHMNLRKFLEDVDSEYTRGSFVSDHDDIIRTGPEMSDQLLSHFYAPLGSQSEAGKAIAQSTKRAVAPNELMEHSIARAASGECVYLSSKIRASMKTDSSAKSEDHGEKKDKKPHMTLVELLLQETTAEEDDHELGRAWIVGRTWCTCYNGARRFVGIRGPSSKFSGFTGMKTGQNRSQRTLRQKAGGSTGEREARVSSSHCMRWQSGTLLLVQPSSASAENQARRPTTPWRIRP